MKKLMMIVIAVFALALLSAAQTGRSESLKATYSSILFFTPAAHPTDVLGICGSSTKTVRVKSLSFQGVTSPFSGGTGKTLTALAKRSTTDGPFNSNATAVPHDSNNPAATASVGVFTANPTLGTPVGNVRLVFEFFRADPSTAELITWNFGNLNDQELVLRGTSQCVYLNLNTADVTFATDGFSSYIEWTEE